MSTNVPILVSGSIGGEAGIQPSKGLVTQIVVKKTEGHPFQGRESWLMFLLWRVLDDILPRGWQSWILVLLMSWLDDIISRGWWSWLLNQLWRRLDDIRPKGWRSCLVNMLSSNFLPVQEHMWEHPKYGIPFYLYMSSCKSESAVVHKISAQISDASLSRLYANSCFLLKLTALNSVQSTPSLW